MRLLVCLFLGSGFLLASCSSSRLMDANQVAAPGEQASRTVLRSNILIKKGSRMSVAYSSGNRFYVSGGGALSGFQKGARNTTIYAEKGALLPEAKHLSQINVVGVDSAERAYQQRFRELPPLKGGAGGGSSDYFEEVDDEDCFDDHEDASDHDRGIRAVSVSPDSYRKND